ncbi:hypothetical protein J8J27_25105, partial [Mycobacterium tuberculosis]|nr:hypothetical protein [Mycobacterium tuberculosis]
VKIGVEPDGFNINSGCGSTAPDLLARKVHEVRADIGIALDGDADRVIIVDEKGAIVDGDQLMAVVARSFLDDGRLSKPGIVIGSSFVFTSFMGGFFTVGVMGGQ